MKTQKMPYVMTMGLLTLLLISLNLFAQQNPINLQNDLGDLEVGGTISLTNSP